MTEAHGENFGPKIDRVEASVYTIPTDAPESDGTFEWTETTVVVVEARSGSECGIGYSYTHSAAVQIIRETLADAVCGLSVMAVSAAWIAMLQKVRNIGRNGVAASAISAVDTALWDLKARTLGVSLVDLFGAVREKIPVYGSGGFTSYSLERLRSQLGGWVEAGIPCVKMKIGTRPEEDVERVRAARDAIGRDAELFVDANGAYSRKQALTFAEAFATFNVSWFEEPVSSDDLEGLKLLRDHAPASMAIAAGEYGYTPLYFRRMLDAGAVDVLQADATRCCGFSGFLQAGVLCDTRSMQLSAHTAPALHCHICCAVAPVVHLEYFHDHVRIESILFDGVPRLIDGALQPDLTRPGTGLALKRADAEPFRRD